jgi:5-methylcytosine-specific restriction endonuclease McrA
MTSIGMKKIKLEKAPVAEGGTQRYLRKPQCGTRSGYDYHVRQLLEEPCEECGTAEKNYHKDRRLRDKERINANRKIWRANNPNVKKSKFTMEEVVAMYGTDCYHCGNPIDFEAPRLTGSFGWELAYHSDHLIPLSKNGPDELENIRPSHGKCNVKKWATVK